MIAHLPFYIIESLVLTLVVWLGIALAANGLRRLGAAIRLRHGRVVVAIWLLLLAADILVGEPIGPAFAIHYQVSMAAAALGAALWLVSMIGGRTLVRLDGFEQEN